MAEHRLWLHPQSHMPASYYAAPQGRRCHLFVKKMRRAETLMFGRLAALPMSLTRKPERRTSVQLFRQAHMERSQGSFGHGRCDLLFAV